MIFKRIIGTLKLQLVEGIRCISARSEISTESLAGRRIQRAFCKGKHIFIAFEGGSFLHNHLLMRGTWKKLGGNQLFLPDDAWLGLHVGAYTICNLNGQMLKLVGQDEVARQLASLGPDAMSQPYPADEIRAALAACKFRTPDIPPRHLGLTRIRLNWPFKKNERF